MMNENLQKYLETFLDEANEKIEEMENSVSYLEGNSDIKEELETIFRAVHTLKGASASMGFEELKNLSHVFEDLLTSMLDGSVQLTESILNFLYSCVEIFKKAISNIKLYRSDCGKEISAEEYQDLIQEIKAKIKNSNTNIHSSVKPSVGSSYSCNEVTNDEKVPLNQAYTVEVWVDERTPMPSVTAFLVYTRLKEISTIIDVTPDVSSIDDRDFKNHLVINLVCDEEEKLRKAALVDMVKEIKIVNKNIDRNSINLPLSQKSVKNTPEGNFEDSSQNQNLEQYKKIEQTIRVKVEKLDTLMNLVGEIVISRSQINEILRNIENQIDTSEMIRILKERICLEQRTISELHEFIMSLRMLPIGKVFRKFQHTVKELSKKYNKEVDLVIVGEDTELDKEMFDYISEPLEHLIRNAIDHGFEYPEERIKKGKPRAGNLFLNAYHKGNHVFIEVSDDGRGIDVEKIKKIVLEKELTTPDVFDTFGKREILEFLFMPGFTTAEKVTELSGRGMGMDVVKKLLKRLRGDIVIETFEGKGTRFSLKLPLTLAIIPALIFESCGNLFAIPISNIVEILNVNEGKIYLTHENSRVLDYRNQVIPIVDLSELFELKGRQDQNNSCFIIVGSEEQKLGLLVDKVYHKKEIVIKTLEDNFRNIEFFTGAFIDSNGSVSLILDIFSIMKHISQRSLSSCVQTG